MGWRSDIITDRFLFDIYSNMELYLDWVLP
jgi:hypothetical protein